MIKISRSELVAALMTSSLCLHTYPAFSQDKSSSTQGCDAYPYSDGMNAELVEGGTKILSTASVSVSFDDIDSVKDARDEATLEAKAAISSWMSESIKSDTAINKVVNETKTMSGEQKQVTRDELVTRLKTLRQSTQALLRGVVLLGDCYTKGREVRVTVGIKPETIKGAENLAGAIGSSVRTQPTPANRTVSDKPNSSTTAPSESAAGASTPLQNVDQFSNTKRLKDF